MDFKAFTEEYFNPVDWINETLNSAENDDKKEHHASNIVYKLQLFIQEINQSLEETAISMINNIPKINRDIELLSEEAKLFKDDLLAIREDINKLGLEPNDTMKTLENIDRIKRRIEEKLKAANED